jgi:hypothetical protein
MESRYLGIFEAVETVATVEKPKASIKGLGEKQENKSGCHSGRGPRVGI